MLTDRSLDAGATTCLACPEGQSSLAGASYCTGCSSAPPGYYLTPSYDHGNDNIQCILKYGPSPGSFGGLVQSSAAALAFASCNQQPSCLAFNTYTGTGADGANCVTDVCYCTKTATSFNALQLGYNYQFFCFYTRCPRGSYCPGGTTQPIACPAGTYSQAIGSSFCVNYPPNPPFPPRQAPGYCSNLAQGKNAYQISTRNFSGDGGKDFSASKAVDGNFNCGTPGGSENFISSTYWDTSGPLSPWWYVDLDSTQTVAQVFIKNRVTCCSGDQIIH